MVNLFVAALLLIVFLLTLVLGAWAFSVLGMKLVIGLLLFAALGVVTAVASLFIGSADRSWGQWLSLGGMCLATSLVTCLPLAAGWFAWNAVPSAVDPVFRWLAIAGLGTILVLDAALTFLLCGCKVMGHIAAEDHRHIEQAHRDTRGVEGL